jgi:MYXO-CTERM domain-containing protein
MGTALRPLALATALACAASPWAPERAHADTQEIGPGGDLEGTINALGPGDELVLQDGEYTLDERFSFDIAGTESDPIVIRAADGATPHLHRPNANQNIIDITSAEHVVMRGLEFSGGSAGVRIVSARFLTLEDCEIHDTGDVALRANDGGSTYEALRILGNHIHHTNNTGEGMYLGCNRDGCQMFDSVIARNHIHHTNQETVSQGDGIELKEGSYNNVIRDNVIHDTNYPCILTYSTVGNGDANLIERNVMWNCGNHAIQSAADATIRNNIILSANANGIAMQNHQNGSPSNMRIMHNTILQATNNAMSLRDVSGPVVIANNALYAESGLALKVVSGNLDQVTFSGNVGVGGVQGASVDGLESGALGADFVDAHYDGAPPIKVFPAAGGALIGAGDAEYMAADDFNGTPRQAADVGAYAHAEDGNPGWTIAPEFKQLMSGSNPGADGGVPPADGGTLRDGGSSSGQDSGTGSGDDGGPRGYGDAGSGGSGSGGGGCRVASTDTAAAGAVWVLATLALLGGRRRRHSEPPRSV